MSCIQEIHDACSCTRRSQRPRVTLLRAGCTGAVRAVTTWVPDGRLYCPLQNIGKILGCINASDLLEGSLLDPDYCIVTTEGKCTRHTKEGNETSSELTVAG